MPVKIINENGCFDLGSDSVVGVRMVAYSFDF